MTALVLPVIEKLALATLVSATSIATYTVPDALVSSTLMLCAASGSPEMPVNCSDVTLGLTLTSSSPPPPPQPATNDTSTSSDKAAAKRLNMANPSAPS